MVPVSGAMPLGAVISLSAANGLTAWAVACGAVLGVGLWAILAAVPKLSRPRLVDRLAPYVADVSDDARAMLAVRRGDPLPVFGMLLAPTVAWIKRMLGSLLGGASVVELRLRQAGSSLDVDAYRSRQLLWGVAGVGVGLVVAAASWRSQAAPVVFAIAVVLVSGAAGLALRDWLLVRAATARVARMNAELPTVLEFMALSLSAGEGVLDALRRVARTSRGELAQELSAVLGDVNTGVPLAESLARCARELQLPALTRCVEQLIGALERGSPLAEVMRAQAQDSREDTKRRLLELAGKKEVAMLVPLVFLILPITVLFAIFPGIFVLQLGF